MRVSVAKAINTLYGSLLDQGQRLTPREKSYWKQARMVTSDDVDDQASWDAACGLFGRSLNEAVEREKSEVFDMAEAMYKPLKGGEK